MEWLKCFHYLSNARHSKHHTFVQYWLSQEDLSHNNLAGHTSCRFSSWLIIFRISPHFPRQNQRIISLHSALQWCETCVDIFASFILITQNCFKCLLSSLCWLFCHPNCILSQWNKQVKCKNQIIVQCKPPIKIAITAFVPGFFFTALVKEIFCRLFCCHFFSGFLFSMPSKVIYRCHLDDWSWRNTTRGRYSVHVASGEFAAHKIACSWWQSG